MTSVVDLSFGHGRYICSGKPLAVMELNKIYVEVRTYRFELGSVESVIPRPRLRACFCSC